MGESNETVKQFMIGQRGPVDHARREQILAAADEHFRHYGYSKTCVSDLARTIGVSSAYVYRFFESKQAIGEAVCSRALGRIDSALMEVANSKQPPAEQLRDLYNVLIEQGLALFFKERKLHEIVEVAASGNWCSTTNHAAALLEVVTKIVTNGRKSGAFERKTAIDKVCRAICTTLTPFVHPILLAQQDPKRLHEDARALSSLVLRSLAP